MTTFTHSSCLCKEEMLTNFYFPGTNVNCSASLQNESAMQEGTCGAATLLLVFLQPVQMISIPKSLLKIQ